MIEVTITKTRAESLFASGIRTVQDPRLGTGEVFVFTGPGVTLAKVAYGGLQPEEAFDPTDTSSWDIAILRIEQDQQS